MALDEKLLEILACPQCKGELIHQIEKDKEALTCPKCRLKYPVRDGIPIMIVDEAQNLEP